MSKRVRIEQYVITQCHDLYQFHKKWITKVEDNINV